MIASLENSLSSRDIVTFLKNSDLCTDPELYEVLAADTLN